MAFMPKKKIAIQFSFFLWGRFKHRIMSTNDVYCSVCLGNVCAHRTVCCPNGHKCCEKHHISRIKAIYESGNRAFGPNRTGQCCFECRVEIGDSAFSENYFKMLRLAMAIELYKVKLNKKPTNAEICEMLVMLETKK